MGLRLRSIRQRIFLLILVPVLSLVGVYAFATFITTRGAINLSQATTIKSATGLPTGALLSQLDAERPLAMVYLSSPTGGNLAVLQVQQSKTNAAAAAAASALTSPNTMNNATGPEKLAIASLLKDIRGLPALRAQVHSQIISKSRGPGRVQRHHRARLRGHRPGDPRADRRESGHPGPGLRPDGPL